MGGRRYTASEREVGFGAIVMADGNCSMASRNLALGGVEIKRTTLSTWKRNHPEELEEHRIRMAPQLEEMRARMAESVATAAGDVTLYLLERTMETADELAPKDLPGAARNTATVYGITTQQGLLHRSKPTAITAHDYSGGMKALDRMGLLVEGEAEEITDAEDPGLIAASK